MKTNKHAIFKRRLKTIKITLGFSGRVGIRNCSTNGAAPYSEQFQIQKWLHKQWSPPKTTYSCLFVYRPPHAQHLVILRQIIWEAIFANIEILLTISTITNPIYSQTFSPHYWRSTCRSLLRLPSFHCFMAIDSIRQHRECFLIRSYQDYN